MTGPKPPPPRPGSDSAAAPAPSTARQRMELAAKAMALREEQLRARVVYVDPSVETNAELDEITARVVKDLKELQRAGMRAKAPEDAGQLEIEMIKTLRELLEKMVSARREHFLRHKVELIQRRIATLFFTREIHQAADSDLTYSHPDEALMAVLSRHLPQLHADLAKLKVSSEDVRTTALERLTRFEKHIANDVLLRSRPELERLLLVYRDAILVFLMKDFRDGLGEFAWEVITHSRVARGQTLAYKIVEDQFPRFREVFERRFLQRLLAALQEPLARRLTEDSEHRFRGETLRFASDPRIYAEICAVTCNSVYDYLHGEGFLDLPVRWQRELYGSPA